MKKYLIKLRPLDKFFFGTGKEFGTDNQNYFIESGYLPQQTSVLGMLRYELLKNADKETFNDNKIQSSEKATKLIGKSSFIANGENDFGKIHSVSPVFLMKGNEWLFLQSKEFQKQEDKEDKKEIISEDCQKQNEANPQFDFLEFSFEEDLPNLSGYSPKEGIANLWSDKNKTFYTYDEIFIPQRQTGIRKQGKNDKKQDQNKAFYVQTFYKMAKDFYFAFYVELADDITLNDATVILGGERQLFKMEVGKPQETQPTDEIENFKVDFQYQSSSVQKAVLLSDAYISEDLETICDFAITDIVNFRCLKATVDTKNYYAIRQKDETKEKYNKSNLHKSAELQLYTKGSVFYFKNEEKQNAFERAIDNQSFKKIGYNHYKLTDKK